MNDDLLPYRLLVCAIASQLVKDSRKQDKEALKFMRSREAQEFFEAWNIDFTRIKRVLEIP